MNVLKDNKNDKLRLYSESLKEEEEKIPHMRAKKHGNEPNFFAKPGDPLKTLYYPHKSLWIFTPDHQIRVLCVYIVNNKYFERLLTLCIIINSINISYGDYSWRAEPNGVEPSGDIRFYIGRVITFIFIGEFMLKIIAMGFLFGKNCYIKDHWNKLDFIVVSTGIYGMLGTGSNGASALRTIRLLRPLRSINKVRGIRVIVTSLLLSLPPLANVGVFLMFIIILFGTFGLHLFYGMFEYRCRFGDAPAEEIIDGVPVLKWRHDPD